MKVGVVVGRFQTKQLHDGHLELLQKAVKENDTVMVFIGVPPIQGTKKDPLDYFTRHFMVEEALLSLDANSYSIQAIKDLEEDLFWSKALDAKIADHLKFNDEVTMYSGQDGFVRNYLGQYHSQFIIQKLEGLHATDKRMDVITAVPEDNESFRAGVIYSIGNGRDVVSATVDIAVVIPAASGEADSFVLCGKKPSEGKWRLPGGFADATDESLEAAARRELKEETGLDLPGPLEYVGSRIVKDWRFKSPDRQVMTTLFVIRHPWQENIAAGDDLSTVGWLTLNHETKNLMNTGHAELMTLVHNYVRSKKQ